MDRDLYYNGRGAQYTLIDAVGNGSYLTNTFPIPKGILDSPHRMNTHDFSEGTRGFKLYVPKEYL
tara:strand:- start:1954 stop:2148 length:195 start_codon:yes stop_codon:yes gene_type:complete